MNYMVQLEAYEALVSPDERTLPDLVVSNGNPIFHGDHAMEVAVAVVVAMPIQDSKAFEKKKN
eukprot:CAMPEP_0198299396 /NCGR_PEP_ID=MMETSP1449-20131203/44623_1 /TAXON_ID=420275 /ORGANISM="Attheya septentrionalis, Strain CCMP2084" /LENGTH=62 /DNA_ID=CAMNT_0044000947 /DNA_START=109 /DNA_END=294 /DNA_ORIENTATION=+